MEHIVRLSAVFAVIALFIQRRKPLPLAISVGDAVTAPAYRLGAGYIAMRIPLVHICLAIVTEYVGTPMDDRIRRILPIVFPFSGILYSLFLIIVLGV